VSLPTTLPPPAERIQVGDHWYVAATSARTEERPQVLKHDETFALFDRFGDIAALGAGSEQGLYHEDTRYLSHHELRVEGARPLFLGSTVKDDSSLLVVELMNPDLEGVAKGTLHIFRGKLLWQGACHEHTRISNHGDAAVSTTLSIEFGADFVDLFEVRGMQRARRGERQSPRIDGAEVVLPYLGLDGSPRRTRLRFDPPPERLSAQRAEFDLRLKPGRECHVYCHVRCERDDDDAPRRAPVAYDQALRAMQAARREARALHCGIETSNPLVDRWIDRSLDDLAMLTTALPTGPYPYAGVPWYACPFGRDGILTAREHLWVDASLARGVLSQLAALQATTSEAARDAEPGKILHESRRSEMAATGEIPFGRYYGSVDSTPLFVGLAGAYWRHTGDLAFIESLWPHVRAALDWIDRHGDFDGDGYVEYARRSSDGLLQQGWKDSHDSVFHADGTMAEAPIALAEVQGYVYEAKRRAAELADALGDAALAAQLRDAAQDLCQRFQRDFWCEELGSYAIALDGRKRPCRVATSNAGHALWSGIASPAHAARIARGLLEPRFHNGFGIRTVAAGQARYNPMSYHNGSVWPHDNALIAAGMTHYGHTDAALQVLSGLFDASLHFHGHRLPELFCGFARREGEGPTLYPVACSPQAWAAAAVSCLLQACLGLQVDAVQRRVSLHSPRLPEFIQWVRLTNLAVGEHRVDLLLQRYANNVGVDVVRNDGKVAVSVSL
jgi:glycogen debranching enzyme